MAKSFLLLSSLKMYDQFFKNVCKSNCTLPALGEVSICVCFYSNQLFWFNAATQSIRRKSSLMQSIVFIHYACMKLWSTISEPRVFDGSIALEMDPATKDALLSGRNATTANSTLKDLNNLVSLKLHHRLRDTSCCLNKLFWLWNLFICSWIMEPKLLKILFWWEKLTCFCIIWSPGIKTLVPDFLHTSTPSSLLTTSSLLVFCSHIYTSGSQSGDKLPPEGTMRFFGGNAELKPQCCSQWRNWRGGSGARRPPWQAKCKKWAPSWRFNELQNMKVLLQVLEILWSWHFKYRNTAVFSKPTFIKWIVDSKLLHAACPVQCITINVRTVCDVTIAGSCGMLPAFLATVLLLALDCVMQLWIRLSESCRVLFL